MHAQNSIIFIGMAFGLALLAYYIRKFILRAMARSYEAGLAERNGLHSLRITALNSDLETITQRRNREDQELTYLRRRFNGVKATSFTSTDYRNLTEITQFLGLALQTWKALKGTESTQMRAEQLIKISRALEHRVFHTVEMANSLNAQPLDTQLIEWLNQRGDLWGDLEQSTISFPHQAETAGYNHLRDALREAFELDMKHQAIEMGRLPMEDVA